jgi:uncharacterized protein YecE (DUF72 family)
LAAVQEEVEPYIGSMGWSYKFWPLYEGLKPSEYLKRYSENFNSVEINSSFYRIPSRRVVENWADQVLEGFRFTAKFPQSISHAPDLDYEEGKLEAFLRNISGLGEKLGPLLLQLPARFKADKEGVLGDFLSGLPPRHTYAVEFRHIGWFNDETYRLLREHNISLVQVEHPKMATVSELTADFAYIRWEGDRKQVEGERGYVELDRGEETLRWAESINALHEEGLTVYGYFSKFYSGYPVSDILMLQKALA